jgi:mediator of RNA polymerase II transcription subunit 5
MIKVGMQAYFMIFANEGFRKVEFQPVYEEFGYILLLVLTIIYRYDLKADDYGGAFVPQLFKKVLLANSAISDGPEDRQKTEGWIKELFEEQGVSNALMSSCQPQEFYNIVPNIISDTLFAARGNHLSPQNLQSGIQCLSHIFCHGCSAD